MLRRARTERFCEAAQEETDAGERARTPAKPVPRRGALRPHSARRRTCVARNLDAVAGGFPGSLPIQMLPGSGEKRLAFTDRVLRIFLPYRARHRGVVGCLPEPARKQP